MDMKLGTFLGGCHSIYYVMIDAVSLRSLGTLRVTSSFGYFYYIFPNKIIQKSSKSAQNFSNKDVLLFTDFTIETRWALAFSMANITLVFYSK